MLCQLAVLGITLILGNAAAGPDFAAQRAALVRDVERDVKHTERYTGRAALKATTLAALSNVPRHRFVPERLQDRAYDNRPLPIGAGQTISQPYIVAMMTDLADVDATSTVLEVGTGSGYQAAVLAEVVRQVYTIEIIASLATTAASTLDQLGYDNVETRIGDGYAGWPEQAPFDAILITAAPDTVPTPLVEQLAVGGKLVVPIGPAYGEQSLQVLTKTADGDVTVSDVLPVRFVPLTRDDD